MTDSPARPAADTRSVVAGFQDAVAAALATALDQRCPSIRRAAREADVEGETLRRFVARERESCQLSTLLQVCIAHDVPVEVRIGDVTVVPRRRRRRRS